MTSAFRACSLVCPTLLVVVLAGCSSDPAQPELVWGKQGVLDGELEKPRAIAITADDRLYLVDYTARIQAFDRNGKFLGVCFTPPAWNKGRPSGLGIGRNGNLLVCDSHYSCLRIYSLDGKLLRTFGEQGTEPGKLSYVSAVVQDADGFFYLAEFGDNQRISKFTEAGQFVKCWGSPGSDPGQFARVRALALGPDGLIYAADACNHRIQVFTRDGELVRLWGKPGQLPGELSYPYDLAFGPAGPKQALYVVEYGNHRVQKFTPEGKSLGCWGGPGRAPGQLASPWALGVDSRGKVHVVDSENHRVQRIDF